MKKPIIHRHGGRVWMEGAVNQGATIFFTLSILAGPLLTTPSKEKEEDSLHKRA